MVLQIISNPFVILWNYSHLDDDVTVSHWCNEHLLGRYQFIVWNEAHFFDANHKKTDIQTLSPKMVLCLFELSKDVTLFKLTWIA